jgi:hypothetical protein
MYILLMPKLTEEKIQQALEFAYEKAITGFIGADSAMELAQFYKNKYPDSELEQVNALIRGQVAKSAASGFISGLGGLMTIPVTLPINLASVLFFQVRMVVAIAIIGGYDPKDEKIKAASLTCLAGEDMRIFLKEIGMEILKQITLKDVTKQLSNGTMVRISRLIGLRLLAKFGSKGAENLTKIVPVIGGLIGGTVDAIWTRKTGQNAKSWFIDNQESFYLPSHA